MIIILYWKLIKYIVYITFGFQSIHLCLYFVLHIFKDSYDTSQNLGPNVKPFDGNNDVSIWENYSWEERLATNTNKTEMKRVM